MAEAESVLPERPKMASFIPSSIDDAFHGNSTPERVNKADPILPPPSSPTCPETSHLTNGSISSHEVSSPITTPAKPSTLKKSSGKKKPSKSSKEINSKHSKKMLQSSSDQSERDNGECPYSDLDSVPKILCPKALERQSKVVTSQPSVTVVREVKKQPEIQTGLWFSKSGKDRRPKTTSPMPDRTLFSKVPCKKKNSSVVSKKTLLPGASSSCGGPSDQSGLSDKHKTLVPAETVLASEESGYLKCKNSTVANSPLDTTGCPNDQSGSTDKQKSLVSVEAAVPSDRCGYSNGRHTVSNTTDTVTGTASDQLGSSDVKKALEPSMAVNFNDQSRFSESVGRKENSDRRVNKKADVIDRISDKAEGKESKYLASTTDQLERPEKQTNLASKCRLPFVKLIRKDIKGKKFLNSSTTVHPGSTKSEKSEKKQDTNTSKMSSAQSNFVDGKASISIDKESSSEPIKLSVKKLKASGGTGILRLSSETSQGKTTIATSELGSLESERIPVLNVSPSKVANSSSNQSDKPEGKMTSDSKVTSISSDQFGSSQQKITTSPVFIRTSSPSHRHGNSECRKAHVPEGLSSEKSKKAIHKSKQVPDKVNKIRLPEQPAHLPASNRLMTRALKAMREAEQKKRERARKEVEKKELLNPHRKAENLAGHNARNSTWNREAKQESCTKTKSLKSPCKDNGKHDQDTSSSCSTPPVVFSNSADFEAEVKSEDEDLSISSTPPMDFIPLTSRVKAKNEDHSSDMCSSSLPASPFSFMNAFKNVEEVSFQSLTNEGDGKPISFKADTNYKFSTFLMMLKDLHDTREREGTPLELEIGPPSAHVKEEPLVMPGGATTAGQDKQIEHVKNNSNSSLDKITIAHSGVSTSRISKRPYHRRSSSTGLKKKANRKVPCRPARSGPGFPGLESLPATDSSSGLNSSVQSLLEIQSSGWERQAGGGGERVVGEGKEDTWSRVNENLQNMVPLEQRGFNTTLRQEQLNGLVADRTEVDTSLMQSAGEGDKAATGKNSLV